MPTAEAKIVRGRPGPDRGIEVTVTVRGVAGEQIMVVDVGASLFSGDRTLCSNGTVETFRVQGFTYVFVTAQSHAIGTVFFPLSDAVLRHIEERSTREVVALSVKLRIVGQYPTGPVPESPGLQGWKLSPPCRVDDAVAPVNVPLSSWTTHLREMAWSEIALFEVPIGPLMGDANLKVALDRLRDAEGKLRGGDYKGVLWACRAAFESAAKYHAAGNVKQGFEALLELAQRNDPRKREPLNAIVVALSDFAHFLGRHEQYPEVGVSRSEAELGYASTVAFFSLLGRRIGGLET